MKKTYFEDPELDILRFQIYDVLTVSDPTEFEEDDYIELPVDPAE